MKKKIKKKIKKEEIKEAPASVNEDVVKSKNMDGIQVQDGLVK